MTLDEAQTSPLDSDSYSAVLREAAYGADNRPAWIGAHRPTTICDELKPLCTWAAAHYNFYLTFVREYMERRGSVLDIGCGAGQNTAMLARYSYCVLGIEPEKVGYEFAMKHNRESGAEFYCDTFPSMAVGLARAPVDYIFCIETIEHVAYELQDEFIRAALGMLRDDGLMFITTPDESHAGGPHHGIWTPVVAEKRLERYQNRLVRRGHFHSAHPETGFVQPGEAATHHAWVLK